MDDHFIIPEEIFGEDYDGDGFTKEELDLLNGENVNTGYSGGDPDLISKDVIQKTQVFKEASETIRQLKARLIRRTKIIDEIRKYYLRDVVTVKYILKDLLTEPERVEVIKRYETALPSLDLKQGLELYAPVKSVLQVQQCEGCGGTLEIVRKDSEEVHQLKKQIEELKERDGRWRIKLATLDAQIEAVGREKAESAKSHMEEKKFLYMEMKKIKEEMETVRQENANIQAINKRVKLENESFRTKNSDLFAAADKLQGVEKELDIVMGNFNETKDVIRDMKLEETKLRKDLMAVKLELNTQQASFQSKSVELTLTKQELSHTNLELKQSEEVREEAVRKAQEATARMMEMIEKAASVENNARKMSAQKGKELESEHHSAQMLQHSNQSLQKQLKKISKELQIARAKQEDTDRAVGALVRVKKSLEIELDNNSLEIEALEDEIFALMKFVENTVNPNATIGTDAQEKINAVIEKRGFSDTVMAAAEARESERKRLELVTRGVVEKYRVANAFLMNANNNYSYSGSSSGSGSGSGSFFDATGSDGGANTSPATSAPAAAPSAQGSIPSEGPPRPTLAAMRSQRTERKLATKEEREAATMALAAAAAAAAGAVSRLDHDGEYGDNDYTPDVSAQVGRSGSSAAADSMDEGESSSGGIDRRSRFSRSGSQRRTGGSRAGSKQRAATSKSRSRPTSPLLGDSPAGRAGEEEGEGEDDDETADTRATSKSQAQQQQQQQQRGGKSMKGKGAAALAAAGKIETSTNRTKNRTPQQGQGQQSGGAAALQKDGKQQQQQQQQQPKRKNPRAQRSSSVRVGRVSAGAGGGGDEENNDLPGGGGGGGGLRRSSTERRKGSTGAGTAAATTGGGGGSGARASRRKSTAAGDAAGSAGGDDKEGKQKGAAAIESSTSAVVAGGGGGSIGNKSARGGDRRPPSGRGKDGGEGEGGEEEDDGDGDDDGDYSRASGAFDDYDSIDGDDSIDGEEYEYPDDGRGASAGSSRSGGGGHGRGGRSGSRSRPGSSYRSAQNSGRRSARRLRDLGLLAELSSGEQDRLIITLDGEDFPLSVGAIKSVSRTLTVEIEAEQHRQLLQAKLSSAPSTSASASVTAGEGMGSALRAGAAALPQQQLRHDLQGIPSVDDEDNADDDSAATAAAAAFPRSTTVVATAGAAAAAGATAGAGDIGDERGVINAATAAPPTASSVRTVAIRFATQPLSSAVKIHSSSDSAARPPSYSAGLHVNTTEQSHHHHSTGALGKDGEDKPSMWKTLGKAVRAGIFAAPPLRRTNSMPPDFYYCEPLLLLVERKAHERVEIMKRFTEEIQMSPTATALKRLARDAGRVRAANEAASRTSNTSTVGRIALVREGGDDQRSHASASAALDESSHGAELLPLRSGAGYLEMHLRDIFYNAMLNGGAAPEELQSISVSALLKQKQREDDAEREKAGEEEIKMIEQQQQNATADNPSQEKEEAALAKRVQGEGAGGAIVVSQEKQREKDENGTDDTKAETIEREGEAVKAVMDREAEAAKKRIDVKIANKSMNAISEVIATTSALFDQTFAALWDALLVNRSTVDFCHKTSLVLEDILQVSDVTTANMEAAEAFSTFTDREKEIMAKEQEQKEQKGEIKKVAKRYTSGAEIIALSERLVPIAQTRLDGRMTEQWRAQCMVAPDMIEALTPKINMSTGLPEIGSFETFFAHKEKQKFADSLFLAADATSKMNAYSAKILAKLDVQLVKTIKDWAVAKAGQVEMDRRLENEKEVVRRQVEIKLRTLGKELNKITELYEKEERNCIELKEKVKEMQKEGKDTKHLLERMSAFEHQIDQNKTASSELRDTVNKLNEELDATREKNSDLTAVVAYNNEKLEQLNSMLESATGEVQALNEQVADLTRDLGQAMRRLSHMQMAEEEKLANQVTTGCQYEWATSEEAVQTDFLVPPMNLHTVMARKTTTKGAVKKVPLVLGHTLAADGATDSASVGGGMSIASIASTARSNYSQTHSLSSHKAPSSSLRSHSIGTGTAAAVVVNNAMQYDFAGNPRRSSGSSSRGGILLPAPTPEPRYPSYGGVTYEAMGEVERDDEVGCIGSRGREEGREGSRYSSAGSADSAGSIEESYPGRQQDVRQGSVSEFTLGNDLSSLQSFGTLPLHPAEQRYQQEHHHHPQQGMRGRVQAPPGIANRRGMISNSPIKSLKQQQQQQQQPQQEFQKLSNDEDSITYGGTTTAYEEHDGEEEEGEGEEDSEEVGEGEGCQQLLSCEASANSQQRGDEYDRDHENEAEKKAGAERRGSAGVGDGSLSRASRRSLRSGDSAGSSAERDSEDEESEEEEEEEGEEGESSIDLQQEGRKKNSDFGMEDAIDEAMMAERASEPLHVNGVNPSGRGHAVAVGGGKKNGRRRGKGDVTNGAAARAAGDSGGCGSGGDFDTIDSNVQGGAVHSSNSSTVTVQQPHYLPNLSPVKSNMNVSDHTVAGAGSGSGRIFQNNDSSYLVRSGDGSSSISSSGRRIEGISQETVGAGEPNGTFQYLYSPTQKSRKVPTKVHIQGQQQASSPNLRVLGAGGVAQSLEIEFGLPRVRPSQHGSPVAHGRSLKVSKSSGLKAAGAGIIGSSSTSSLFPRTSAAADTAGIQHAHMKGGGEGLDVLPPRKNIRLSNNNQEVVGGIVYLKKGLSSTGLSGGGGRRNGNDVLRTESSKHRRPRAGDIGPDGLMVGSSGFAPDGGTGYGNGSGNDSVGDYSGGVSANNSLSGVVVPTRDKRSAGVAPYNSGYAGTSGPVHRYHLEHGGDDIRGMNEGEGGAAHHGEMDAQQAMAAQRRGLLHKGGGDTARGSAYSQQAHGDPSQPPGLLRWGSSASISTKGNNGPSDGMSTSGASFNGKGAGFGGSTRSIGGAPQKREQQQDQRNGQSGLNQDTLKAMRSEMLSR